MLKLTLSSIKKFRYAWPVIVLVAMSIEGCAHGVYFTENTGYSTGDDCRFCHTRNATNRARDFSSIYDDPNSHHPVGVMYPLGSSSRDDFNQPNGYIDDTIFFDDDGYGELDEDDVRLFGKGNAVTVECASCHKEHGESPKYERVVNHYLRVSNESSRLCSICHVK